MIYAELKKSSVAKEKIQRAKEKAQRPVIGNMDPLLDALTSIIDDDDEEMDDTPGHTKQTTSRLVKPLYHVRTQRCFNVYATSITV